MKITQLVLAAAAALGFCTLQVKAQSVTTQPLHLSVSITVVTNKDYTYSAGVYRYGTGSIGIGNKQLLDLFAKWNGIVPRSSDATWSKAKLVIGTDKDNDVLVVDATGTNILFDATEGTNDASFYIDFYESEGAYTEVEKDLTPGYETYSENYLAYYELYDDTFSDYIYLRGYGRNQQSFTQHWDSNDAFSTWSDSESAAFLLQGDNYWNDYQSSSKATITASGSGKGESNLY